MYIMKNMRTRTKGRKLRGTRKYTCKKRGGKRKHLKHAEIEEIVKRIMIEYPNIYDESRKKMAMEDLISRLEKKDLSSKKYTYEFNDPESDGRSFNGKDARKDTHYRRGLDYAIGIWTEP